jgi:hypothetical protein
MLVPFPQGCFVHRAPRVPCRVRLARAKSRCVPAKLYSQDRVEERHSGTAQIGAATPDWAWLQFDQF